MKTNFLFFGIWMILYWIGCVFGDCSTDVTKNLLKVTKGYGVSFIDLWNLKGTKIGNHGDAIYRNGLIDRNFTYECPKKIYMHISINQLIITYSKRNFQTTSLSAWISDASIYTLSYAITQSSVDIELSPVSTSGIDLWIKEKSDPNKFYASVLFDPANTSMPMIFSVGDKDPFTGITGGIERDALVIKARYDCSCTLTEPTNTHSMEIDEIKNKLYPSTTTVDAKTTAGIVGTATTTESLTTKETSETSNLFTTEPPRTYDLTVTSIPSSTGLLISTDKTTSDTPGSFPPATDDVSTTTPGSSRAESPGTDESITTTSGISSPESHAIDDSTIVRSSAESHSTDESPSMDKTTSLSVSTETTSNSKMCKCSCEYQARLEMLKKSSNMSLEELKEVMQPELDEIKRKYTWDKTKTSSFKRKKISAADKRKSSEQIGIIASTFIGVVVALVVLIDVVAFKRHIGVLRRNLFGQ